MKKGAKIAFPQLYIAVAQCVARQSVKILAVAPPPVSNSPKKGRRLCQCLSTDVACQKRNKISTPAVGPLCVKLCKKRSSSVTCQILGHPAARVKMCQSSGPPVSKCQSVKFRPAPGPLLTRSFNTPHDVLLHYSITPARLHLCSNTLPLFQHLTAFTFHLHTVPRPTFVAMT